ncbi:serine hydrolase domain-containing protein [Robiginitalea sp. IMCC43444]|uniref:serine hydrolase domain-containing protein n=1 Tax=Robiginitalea sp. IMCC43444 TaxID=3459121 RepID=UPI00404143C2
MKRNVMLIVFLSLNIILLQGQETIFYPDQGQQWEERSAESFGISGSSLQDAVKFAMANEYSGDRDLRRAILKGFAREPYHELLGPVKKRGGPAGVILKNGYLLASWGDIKRVDMTFSVTKSFLSTVAGLAKQKGLIPSMEDKVADYIWDGTFEGEHNKQISWAHLLQQNSDWSGSLWGLHDWADRPPAEGGIDQWRNRELREPGTVMEYNDVRVNVLAYSLTHVWRKPLPQVLKEELMDPIGASSSWRWFGYDHAWTIIDGLKMQSVTGGGHSGAGIFISAEDMARFGLLFMGDGKWKGQSVISDGWIQEAMTPSVPNTNYGYMWWLNRKGPRQWEGVPEHVFYAAGFGGNFIIVDQKNELVMVLRWLEPSQVGEFVAKVYHAMP